MGVPRDKLTLLITWLVKFWRWPLLHKLLLKMPRNTVTQETLDAGVILLINNSILQEMQSRWNGIIWCTPHHKRFMAIFLGPPGWAGARREHLDFVVQWKINRSRHTNHPARRYSSQTNQCPPPPSPPHFLQTRCPSCHPTNSVKALKATSAFR